MYRHQQKQQQQQRKHSNYSEEWLQAIEQCTSCLMLRGRSKNGGSGGDGYDNDDDDQQQQQLLDDVLKYLDSLEGNIIYEADVDRDGEEATPGNSWDRPPTSSPPPPPVLWKNKQEKKKKKSDLMTTSKHRLQQRRHQNNNHGQKQQHDPKENNYNNKNHHHNASSPMQIGKQQQQQQQHRHNKHRNNIMTGSNSNNNNNSSNNSNRFAMFEQDSDTSRDDDDDESEDGTYDEEAGDKVFHHRHRREAKSEENPTKTTTTTTTVPPPSMDIRRIMIRILNAQSDVYAMKALQCRKIQQNWTLGAEQYGHCLHKIHTALSFADTAISQCLNDIAALQQQQYNSSCYYIDDHNQQKQQQQRLLEPLMEDADIVEVAVMAMTQNREMYLTEAQKQAEYLQRQLKPQWESRDEIKSRMGKNWYSNRNPKQNYALLRKQQEQQLFDIQKSISVLLEMDVEFAQVTSQKIQNKLQQQNDRYNGQRPTNLSQRVGFDDYPDPTEFGWTFTGSNSNSSSSRSSGRMATAGAAGAAVEFFEKHNMKLDWYYTTGKIQTNLMMDSGNQQTLFELSWVDPETYRVILLES